MKNYPIIIIGAGAAGLIACRELLRNGKHVILIEGQEQAGGRIHTFQGEKFLLEAGAEFIHGDLPITTELLHEYGIVTYETMGSMGRFDEGEEEKTNNFVDHWDLLMKEMKKLEEDLPLREFLNMNFPGEKFQDLRKSAIEYAEGFDLADIGTVSTLFLYNEWVNEDLDSQYRIEGGYKMLTEALLNECKNLGAEIHFSSIIKSVGWSKDAVDAVDAIGNKYKGSKIVVTIPLGVFRADKSSKTAISFYPEIPLANAGAGNGFGGVIKILLECKKNFWSDEIEDLGFIFSDEILPTWWTQLPRKDPILTGWAGHSRTEILHSKSEKEILDLAVHSLAKIFKKDRSEIESSIIKGHVFNWMNNPFSLGGYSFPEVRKSAQSNITAVDETIFFAGEGYWDGPDAGTVEAALRSGLETAQKINSL